ncbi:DeoR/GlpR transcriptional regulator [Leucobacter viscericola]|uniref:DeoR/GlpR transcriptional regulator n=1 Tax=Leucobacter viscericola TaxID=2714935 RepID=A0A6G7XDE9_9MICO|nr:DeoR/GlpR family DNA-binding transcription regulator [Leucobacter viscericola]QIK62469.1 DeoR/GlpR transcriptional regulator [Leucobacter viscericola]
MAVSGSIDAERRRKDLADLIARGEEISIDEARLKFNVSAMTIRRDIEALENEGVVRRVRGGAVSAPAPRSYDDRLATRSAAKLAIARKALALVPHRGAIALDASTTVHALAEILGGDRELTVCTNSVQTFEVLTRLNGIDAQLTGGSYERVTGSLVGPIANAGARLLFTQVFFTSAAALHPEGGTSESSLAEAEVKRHLAESAERTVLCVDSSKLGGRSVGAALELASVSTLITELPADDPRLDPYRHSVDVL